jgi:hypothetical protein
VVLLEKYHENLSLHAKSLASDKEAVILAARELGYYQSNEGRIILANGKTDGRTGYIVGTFVKPYKAKDSNNLLLIIIALLSGSAAAIISWNYIQEVRRR